MNILITPHNWFGTSACAGGEWYLLRLCQSLQDKGHEIRAITPCDKLYAMHGIPVFPQGDLQNQWNSNPEHFEWADIIIHQLLGNAYGHNMARKYNKQDVLICHNTSRHYFTTNNTAIVYNSHALGNLYPNNNSTVLQPLVDCRNFKRSRGRKIALINCNENKGVRQFIELAEMLPQYQFIGYKGGYGDQITPDIPNIEWRENGDIDWSEIGILLAPSETESWNQAATEAICCGIPVICSDLPGLRENLSYAGIYINKMYISLYAGTIIELMENKSSYNYASERSILRSIELDPLPRIDEFNNWLCHL